METETEKETVCDSEEKIKQLLKHVEKGLIDRILSGEDPIQLLIQSDELLLPCNNNSGTEDNHDDKLYKNIFLWTALHVLRNVFEKQEQIKGEGINGENKENVLPISTKDLPNTSMERAINWRAFLRSVRSSVNRIPPEQHGTMLLLCGSFLGYQVKNLSTPFDIQSGNSSSHSLLSFGDALPMFLPEMAHITKFILCYFLTMILVWPLQLGVQLILLFLLISAPLYYFPELARKARASGVHVDCGSFNLPLIWYASFGALGLSFICGLMTLLMVYFSWRHIHEKGSQEKELKVSVDALSGVLAA